ncbi:hypothetical protein [uncultured Nostoc sp.]
MPAAGYAYATLKAALVAAIAAILMKMFFIGSRLTFDFRLAVLIT